MRFPACTGGIGAAAHQVREIGAKAASAVCSPDCVAVHAGGCFNILAGEFSIIRIRWLALPFTHALKSSGLSTYTRKSIFACMRPTITVRIGREIEARIVRIQPHFVYSIRNQICLPGKLRNPEAVIGVCGQQFQECR